MADSVDTTNPTKVRKCAVDGCKRPMIGRNLCRAHYTTWWEKERKQTPCSVAGCDRSSRTKGMCKLHYTRSLRVANVKICIEDGCKRTAVARGLCNTHYPLRRKAGTLPEKRDVSLTEAFLREHVSHAGRDCLEWPFGCTPKGYSWATVGGVQNHGHRWMCIMAHGEPPFPDAEVCHSCNNRSCVNPNHLRWDTRVGNMADQYEAGTRVLGERCPNAKLTEKQVLQIRKDPRSHVEIAKQYSVQPGTISCVKRRITWTHI